MKKGLALLLLLLLLIPQGRAWAQGDSDLGAPAELAYGIPMPRFTVEDPAGTLLTTQNYGNGRDLLMIYGTTLCSNTRAMMLNIRDYVPLLAEHGVTVLVVLLQIYDDTTDSFRRNTAQEVEEFGNQYPGVKIVQEPTTGGSGMWEGLRTLGYDTSMVTLPVVFLKDADNGLLYGNTGYHADRRPEVAGALAMADGAEILELPAELTTIDQNAFQGGSFSAVRAGDGLRSIGAEAFADCRNLRRITIPNSVTFIDPTAFQNGESPLIRCAAGSYAESFARKNGFNIDVS